MALLHRQGEILCQTMETSAPQGACNHEGDQAGKQLAQKGCGVSIFEMLQNSLDTILPDQGVGPGDLQRSLPTSAILWPCDTHKSQQQTLAIATHQCTGVRKNRSSHAIFFTACPNGFARAFCELTATFSLPNPSSLLCHRALPQDLRGTCVTLPLCFPKCVTPGTTSLFPQEQGTCTSPATISQPCHAHSSQRGSCSHGSRPWLSRLCQVCANRPSATHFNLLFFLPPFLILHTAVILQAAWARYHSHYLCLVSSPDVSRGCCMLLQYKWLMMMIKGVGVGCLECYPTLITLF